MEHPSTSLVVCVKWVATSPEVDPLTGTVATDARFSGLSPADLTALEWALRLGDQQNKTVAAVTVGGPEADGGLRQALAHGARAALRIPPGASSGITEPSSQTVARLLAMACRSATLVLCGDHSLDRGSGSVPAFLAHELGFGQALGCVGLTLDGGSVVAERRLDQGRRERLAVADQTVLSFEGGLELRRASLAATLASTDAEIVVSEGFADDLAGQDSHALTVSSTGPYRPRPRALAGPTGNTLERIRQLTGVGQEPRTSQQLELDPAEAARVVLDQLQAWGYVPDMSDRTEEPAKSPEGPRR